MNSPEKQTIYLIAICGTGMASLAGLLKEGGYNVIGSDTNVYPPMSDLLANFGIEISQGYKKENISSDIDLVIIGNAVSVNNEEVQAVMQADIPYISFPQAIARFFLQGRKSLVVAGTHGKTTTASLLSWVFHEAGMEPGFMIGGWLKKLDSNHRYPTGDYFIIEGDEYDTAFFDKGPKFLHYRPFASILTGIEFDHADIYKDLDHIMESFRNFVRIIHPPGFLLIDFFDKNIKKLLNEAQCEVETYGFSEEADWSVGSYRRENGKGHFTLSHHGKAVGDFSLPMIGKHNAGNAAAVAAMGIRCGLSADEVSSALSTFPGIKRRQEVVGEKNGVIVMDDFAHHPTAIRLTIEAVKEAYPKHKVWAVFEPRSATSRRNIFQDDLPDCFRAADKVIIAGLFAPEKIKPEDRLDPASLVEKINHSGGDARFIPEVDAIVEHITSEHGPQDVVLVMSSGGFYGIHQKLLDRL